MVERVTTIATTIRLIAITSLVFSRIAGHPTPQPPAQELLIGSLGQAATVRTIFFQLVVQSLEANAKNLCGACLVVVRARKRAQDQLLLSLFDRCANTQMNRIGINFGGPHLRGAESRWQVPDFDHLSGGENHCAF